jgi:hypothetical protein
MSLLPEFSVPVPEFINLPQATLWLIAGVQPVAPAYDTNGLFITPPLSENAAPYMYLFSKFLSGELTLYGKKGINPRASHPLDMLIAPVRCDSLGETTGVPKDAVERLGIRGIDWQRSLMHGDLRANFSDYWGELRIRWADLYRLTAEDGIRLGAGNPGKGKWDDAIEKEVKSRRGKTINLSEIAKSVALTKQPIPTEGTLKSIHQRIKLLSERGTIHIGKPVETP